MKTLSLTATVALLAFASGAAEIVNIQLRFVSVDADLVMNASSNAITAKFVMEAIAQGKASVRDVITASTLDRVNVTLSGGKHFTYATAYEVRCATNVANAASNAPCLLAPSDFESWTMGPEFACTPTIESNAAITVTLAGSYNYLTSWTTNQCVIMNNGKDVGSVPLALPVSDNFAIQTAVVVTNQQEVMISGGVHETIANKKSFCLLRVWTGTKN